MFHKNCIDNIKLFLFIVSCTQCPTVTQCEHSMTITIYQSQTEITPSVTSQQIITESVIPAPNIEERDILSPIIGGVIGFGLGVTTVVIIWIIIMCILSVLRREKMDLKLNDNNQYDKR